MNTLPTIIAELEQRMVELEQEKENLRYNENKILGVRYCLTLLSGRMSELRRTIDFLKGKTD